MPRRSQDLDLVIADAALEALHRRSQFNVIDMATAWKGDTLISKMEWAKLGGGSELQIRDAAGILSLYGREKLDIALRSG